jgi:hypothetical protein
VSDSCDTQKATQEARPVNTAGQRTLGPFTVDDWFALDERQDGSSIEVLWGHFLVNPHPGGPHQYAAAELWLVLKTALRDAGRHDLYPVTRAAAEISADRRTGLIPDMIVVNIRPIGYPSAENLLLVAEIWSPDNDAKERADKARPTHWRECRSSGRSIRTSSARSPRLPPIGWTTAGTSKR